MSATETVTAAIAALQSGDLESFADLCTEDMVFEDIPTNRVSGRDDVLELLRGFVAVADGLKLGVLHQIAAGNVVMVERHDSFRLHGKSIEIGIVGVFEVHGDKITAWREYSDHAWLADTELA